MCTNSVPGVQQKGSLQGSHLDFVNYWADQTVEEAVLRGTQLRQEKSNPLPSRQYDVVNIDYIKAPQSANSARRRRKSRKKRCQTHTSRSTSSCCRESPRSLKRSNRYGKCRKTKKKVPCGMRIAELAVPTKRQCLDTWRNKCHTLPAYMIERLRQHVMDERPVVQITDAIYCFKRKCKKETRTARAGDKKSRSYNNKTKTLRTKEVKTISAMFGAGIAKKLNIPQNIVLNSDLDKIANIISYDIEDLICKSKKIDKNNAINKAVLTDITKKVTVWISDVLEESSYKYLEDELKDFEDEAGPVLDFVDDLFDGVLDICMPQVEIDDKSSSSYFEAAGLGRDILEQSSNEKVSVEILSSLEDDKSYKLPEIDVYENIENHFKNLIIEIITRINTKSNEHIDIDNGADAQTSEEVNKRDEDEKSEKKLEFETAADEKPIDEKSEGNIEFHEQTTVEKGEDNLAEELENYLEDLPTDEKTDEHLEFDTNFEVKHMETDNVDDTDRKTEENIHFDNNPDFEFNVDTEAIDTDTKKDEYPVLEDLASVTEKTNEIAEIKDTEVNDFDKTTEMPFENVDNYQNVEEPDTFADAIDDNEGQENSAEQQIGIEASETFPGSSDENDKKVTFDKIAVDVGRTGNVEPNEHVNVLNTKPSIDHIKFAPPNEDLLSDADESWPEEAQPPFIRPSQSVSKSITSLGKINENDEKTSVSPFGKLSTIGQGENDSNLTSESKPQEQDLKQDEKSSVETEEQNLTKPQIDKVQDMIEKEVIDIEKPVKGDDQVTSLTSEKTTSKSKMISIASEKAPSKSGKTKVSAKDKPKRISETKTSEPSSKKHTKRIMKKITTPGAKPVKPPKTNKAKKIKEERIKERASSAKDKMIYVETAETILDLDKCIDGVEHAEKAKPDYRVNEKTAPAWVRRNVGESKCSCANIVSKPKVSEKRNIKEYEIRRWCNDVEQGYKNLKTWNEWIDNTSRTVYLLRREIGSRECVDKCSNKEWAKFKRNIDKDAALWRKMNQNTQERLKCYRKMYQKRTEVPKNYRITCDCSQPKLYNI